MSRTVHQRMLTPGSPTNEVLNGHYSERGDSRTHGTIEYVLIVLIDTLPEISIPDEISDLPRFSTTHSWNSPGFVDDLVRATETQLPPPGPHATMTELAASLAGDLRDPNPKGGQDHDQVQSVFIVHGHDLEMLNEVTAFVEGLDIQPVILQRIRRDAPSLFQRFMTLGIQARFAIVLISADDVGALRRHYKEGGDAALRCRARQNVILELGFFYGHLGWENVVVLQRPHEGLPYFERPSDLDGVVYYPFDDDRDWQTTLRDRLGPTPV